MAGCVFARLFSPEVVNIRNGNIHCSCLEVAELASNTPIPDYGISDLFNLGGVRNIVQVAGLAAYLSFEDFLYVSECSKLGWNIGIQRGGRPRQMLEFLRIRSGPRKLRWQRVKTRIMEGETAQQSAVMKNREIFWIKLQFQLQTHLQGLHHYSNEASSRRLTIHDLLCDIGILDGHKHLNHRASTLLALVIPERRYWEHWFKHWKFIEEPSELNVVLGILAFTLYITRVCDTCKEALETRGYRIHSEFGVQLRYYSGGNVMWNPDPQELGRWMMAALRR